ncbi:MAG: MarR family winged helix-turn-helix transcriptional regulator [Dermatophilaceae bacterium]|nr:MarR family transcriptional regulator [Intrasporangiaceae bacterium]
MTDWLTSSQQRAWRALLDMNTHLHARLARSLQDSSDLSYADFAVLVQLTEAPDGRARISELADLLQWERSRLSHHLKRMESRGHIERSHCPEDGRGQYVSVTPIGRAAIEQAAPSHVELVRELVFADMSDAEMDALTALGERVVARLGQVPQKVT